MRIKWTYELMPVDVDSPLDGAAPLHWDGGAVLVPTHRFAHAREARATDASARGYVLDVHRVRPDGVATVASLPIDDALISSSWSFLSNGDEHVLHSGGFHSVTRSLPLAGLPFVNATHGAGRGLFCRHDDLVLCADLRTSTVHALDFAADREVWRLALPNRHNGAVGPIAMRDGRLVCWGHDTLGTYEPATGELVDSFHLPGMGMLEPPRAHEGDLLFVWSTGKDLFAGDWAGVLRRVRVASGEVADELRLRDPIATAPLVVGKDVYAFRWPKKQTGSPALVAVET